MKACRGAILCFAVASLLSVIFTGCASTPTASPVSAWVSYRHFERDQTFTLVTRGFEDFEATQRAGKLPPSVKLVDAETMGSLVRQLERRGFFERAEPLSPDAPGIEARVPQILAYRDGSRTRTLLFSSRNAKDAEAFVEMKQALLETYDRTFSLSVSNEPFSTSRGSTSAGTRQPTDGRSRSRR